MGKDQYYILLVGMQTAIATMGISMEVPNERIIGLVHDTALSFCGMHTWRILSQHTREKCTAKFTAVLFTTAMIWHQPSWMKIETIENMWCIPTMEFYSVTKENEFMTCAGEQIQLESIMLSEARLRKTSITCLCICEQNLIKYMYKIFTRQRLCPTSCIHKKEYCKQPYAHSCNN